MHPVVFENNQHHFHKHNPMLIEGKLVEHLFSPHTNSVPEQKEHLCLKEVAVEGLPLEHFLMEVDKMLLEVNKMLLVVHLELL